MTSQISDIEYPAEGSAAPWPIENVLTGGDKRERHLLYQLKISMAMAESIDIIVSFLMESGVKMLLGDLQAALDRGVPVRILTGNYLGITQPSALYLIKKELGGRVDLRLYNEPSRSFHPKAYIFHYAGTNHIYVGSSNISFSALTSGIEWNYRLSSQADPSACQDFMDTFEELFESHSIHIDDEFLKAYSRSWHRPAVAKDLERYGDYGQDGPASFFEPRGAQIEALYALQQSREEGAVKGLVHAATGVGKTYLAAFDSKDYKRVLFVAHREEILRQAAVSFANVRGSEDYGFFTGGEKATDRSVIFASVSSLGQARYLNEKYFAPDYFDYIVVDAYGIIGLNSKGSANKGFLKLSPILFSPQMRLMIDLRRKHAQNEDLSAKRSAACNSGSTVSDVVPSRLLQRQSAEHTPDVDLHRSTVRYSKDVSLACAA